MNNNILSLLGLALRGGRLAVGEEPAALAAKAGQSRLLLTASDAAANTLRRAEHLAQVGRCLHLTLPFTKAELGGALGRGTAAIAALTDTGLAAALTERLAALDPEGYGEAAARMDLKLRRAKERKDNPRPPRKAPPPRREDRRPPASRREGGPDSRGRPPRDGRRDRPPRPGEGRPQGGRPARDGNASHSGRPAYGGKPAHGGKPPYGGKPAYRGTSGGKPGRPQGGRPGGGGGRGKGPAGRR